MRVLTVTNMYPTAARPVYGIFVGEQVEALSRHCGVVPEVYHIDTSRGRRAYLRSLLELPRIIAAGGYDIVHVHYGLSGLFMLRPFWTSPTATLLTLHGGDIQPEQGKPVQVALTRKILQRVDAAVALNERMARLASECCSRVEQIACGVDTQLFSPGAAKAKDGTVRLLFVSDPSRRVKNYPLFQSVAAILRQRYGFEIEELQLSGFSREEASATMRSADLLLLTSISEGSPQVVKEALACDLAVVSTPVGDVRRMLAGLEGCAVAASHDADELARLAAESLSGRIAGSPRRQRIFDLKLDEKSTAERVYNLYCSLL